MSDNTTTNGTTYTIYRDRHAAHTGDGTGWDLEWIDIPASEVPTPIDLPSGFTYHSGYRDRVTNERRAMFARRVELSPGSCERCDDLNTFKKI